MIASVIKDGRLKAFSLLRTRVRNPIRFSFGSTTTEIAVTLGKSSVVSSTRCYSTGAEVGADTFDRTRLVDVHFDEGMPRRGGERTRRAAEGDRLPSRDRWHGAAVVHRKQAGPETGGPD